MRLFIGINIPVNVSEQLQRALEKIDTSPLGLKTTDTKNLHLTLAFLGNVDEENVEILKHLLTLAISNPPQGGFVFKNFETFPRKHPRYLIARAEPENSNEWEPYIEKMRDMISVAAPSMDRKPWIPHLTFGRAKKGRLLPRWNFPCEEIHWKPVSINLIESKPSQYGANYEIIYEPPVKF